MSPDGFLHFDNEVKASDAAFHCHINLESGVVSHKWYNSWKKIKVEVCDKCFGHADYYSVVRQIDGSTWNRYLCKACLDEFGDDLE